MCGIIGLISKRKNGFYGVDTDLFTDALICDSVRGVDGTGVFGVYQSGNVGWLKVGSHPYALISNPSYEKWRQAMIQKFDIVVGHNRKATSGSTSNENAHPFHEENIILVHNGSIMNSKQMAETEVDSHAIVHEMVKSGHLETLKKLQGAFALVWFDIKTRNLHLVRNSERPLEIAENDDLIAIASEGEMLDWLGSRKNIIWKSIRPIEPGVLWTINQVTKKVEQTKVEFFKWTGGKSNKGDYSGWTHSGDTSGGHTIEYPEGDKSAVQEWMDAEQGSDVMSGESVDTEELMLQKQLHDQEAELQDQVDGFVNKDTSHKVDILKQRDTVAEDLFRSLRPGDYVYWVPVEIQSFVYGGDRQGYNLKGYLKRDNSISVRASFLDVNQKELDFFKSKEQLKSQVTSVNYIPNMNERNIRVSEVSVAKLYKVYNGTLLNPEEWFNIVNHHKCSKCNGDILGHEVLGTSVSNDKGKKGKTRIFCVRCVAEKFNGLSDANKEAIVKINGVSPLSFITDKPHEYKDDTAGSAHSS